MHISYHKHTLNSGVRPEALTITFSDEDYAITNRDHNRRPLYFEGYWKGIVFKIILADTGFSINLIPLRQVLEAGFTRNDLEPAYIVISGFN